MMVSLKEDNMTKHILDRPSTSSPTSPARAIRIERSFYPKPGTVALQRRHRKRLLNLRAKYYLRFAHGQTA